MNAAKKNGNSAKGARPVAKPAAKPTKDQVCEADTVAELCWHKAMGMISVEARELIFASRALTMLCNVFDPEHKEAERAFRLAVSRTGDDRLREEMGRAEQLLTGVSPNYFRQWSDEGKALMERIEQAAQAPKEGGQ